MTDVDLTPIARLASSINAKHREVVTLDDLRKVERLRAKRDDPATT